MALPEPGDLTDDMIRSAFRGNRQRGSFRVLVPSNSLLLEAGNECDINNKAFSPDGEAVDNSVNNKKSSVDTRKHALDEDNKDVTGAISKGILDDDRKNSGQKSRRGIKGAMATRDEAVGVLSDNVGHLAEHQRLLDYGRPATYGRLVNTRSYSDPFLLAFGPDPDDETGEESETASPKFGRPYLTSSSSDEGRNSDSSDDDIDPPLQRFKATLRYITSGDTGLVARRVGRRPRDDATPQDGDRPREGGKSPDKAEPETGKRPRVVEGPQEAGPSGYNRSGGNGCRRGRTLHENDTRRSTVDASTSSRGQPYRTTGGAYSHDTAVSEGEVIERFSITNSSNPTCRYHCWILFPSLTNNPNTTQEQSYLTQKLCGLWGAVSSCVKGIVDLYVQHTKLREHPIGTGYGANCDEYLERDP